MFFRNIEPWECSLLFPWFQCVEQKAGAPVWLRLICGPRATSLAVCTIVVLLCRVCTSLLCVCTSLCHDCTSLWRVCTSLCPDCTSVTTSLDDLLDTHLSIVFSSDAEYPMPFRNLVNSASWHIVKTSGAALHARKLRHHFWGTKEIFGASAAVSEQSKKRLLIVIDKHGLRLQLSWALCWQGYHVTNLNTCPIWRTQKPLSHSKTLLLLNVYHCSIIFYWPLSTSSCWQNHMIDTESQGTTNGIWRPR